MKNEMNAETPTPLEESIQHWLRMETGAQQNGEVPYSDHCSLCRAFRKASSCDGCPVFQKTEKTGCQGTPYSDAECEFSENNFSVRFRELAKLEREFLESLLP